LQVLGFVLVFIGSIPVALEMLNFRDEKALVRAGEEPVAAN
jgi:hypothetical protein